MNRSFRAQLVISGLALVLGGCFDSGGGNSLPDPPNPPQVINTPPTANAGTDQVVAPGSTVNLSGSGTDSNGTIATYAWTQTGGTAVALASSGTATPSFTAPAAAGALTFQLSVTDNGGASHTDTVTVTVNGLPVANAGTDQTVSAGAAVSLTGTGSDADGSVASYAWAQTSGPAVTLGNANTATLTFTAPSAAASLGFSLTVTDNNGATHVDSVSVTVTAIIIPLPPPASPAIGRHPNNALALEHGSAMLFVAASGEDLNYEWRRASGTVVKSGPEPFLLITSLNLSENNDCYYVVVSNDAGIVTSEQGCLTVEEIDWEFDPSDDPDNGDDYAYAGAYGNSLFSIAQTITGPFTGYTGGPARVGFPRNYGPPRACHRGSYGGITIDGVLLTSQPQGPLPLGHHVISEGWNDCYDDPDDTDADRGGYMVEYDFPQTWGVGTITLHVSSDYFNGTVHATLVANDDGVHRSDDIEITIADNFSMGDLKASSEQSISVDRRYTNDGLRVDDVYVDLDASLSAFDMDGSAGSIGARQGGFFHLHQDFGGGDDGEPDFTSSGIVVVGSGTYVLASLGPSGSHNGWTLQPLPEEECPEGYICVDPPPVP